MTMQALLAQGIQQLNIAVSQRQQTQLLKLLDALLKWNKVYNLTAITDTEQALKLHLLDSLAVVPFWQFTQTLDVGTGAGFPGLPLAMVLPEQKFHLLDSNSKKIRFIRQQIHELGLSNVTAFHCRVEEHTLNNYDCITSRAFASLTDMLQTTNRLLLDNGKWMALKGVYSAEEVSHIPSFAKEVSCHSLVVPGIDAERCIIELIKTK